MQLEINLSLKNPAKVVKKYCLTKKKQKIMKKRKFEKILRQFISRSKYDKTEINITCTALFRISYGKQFILRIESKKYENGILKIDNVAHMYFETHKELQNEIQYHYESCNKNLFNSETKITI